MIERCLSNMNTKSNLPTSELKYLISKFIEDWIRFVDNLARLSRHLAKQSYKAGRSKRAQTHKVQSKRLQEFHLNPALVWTSAKHLKSEIKVHTSIRCSLSRKFLLRHPVLVGTGWPSNECVWKAGLGNCKFCQFSYSESVDNTANASTDILYFISRQSGMEGSNRQGRIKVSCSSISIAKS